MSRDAAANSGVLSAFPIEFEAVPGHSRLFLEFLNVQTEKSKLFWPNRDIPLQDYSSVVLEQYATERDRLCDGLLAENEAYGATPQTLANVGLLRDAECVAVVTGQQAGFLGGPAYTVYKALTAILIASDLAKKGVKAVPVFWIATEDHDFEEISVSRFRDNSGSLLEGRLVQRESDAGKPVGDIRIGPEAETVLDEMFSTIPQTRFTAELGELARSSYKPGLLLGQAFGRLLTRILGNTGLVFVNPLNPVIRELSKDIFVSAIDRSGKIRDELTKRDELLERNGFHSQVHVSKGFVPFFAIDDQGKRKALEMSNHPGRFVTKDRKLELGESDLLRIAKTEPERLSPNALMRPIVQDAIFPTVCYVGGAAEICYFAQNSSIYEVLGRPVTPIRHRSAFTILEARHRRSMRAYDIGLKDVFGGREALAARLAEEIADPVTMTLFDETEDMFESQLGKIESALDHQAPDVAGNLKRRRKKIKWHIEALRRNFMNSQAKRNEDLTRRIGDLFDNVMPGGSLQERSVSYIDILNIHGPNFTDWIYRHVETNGDRHKGLFF